MGSKLPSPSQYPNAFLDLCSAPRKDDLQTKASIAFAQDYKGVSFETINGDIADTQVDAIVSSVDQAVSSGVGALGNVFAKAGQ